MKKMYILALTYLYVPLMIFICFWLKIWLAVPLLVAILVALYFGTKKMLECDRQELLFRSWELVVLFIIFLIAVVLCGAGDLFKQDYDWRVHHAVLYDLVDYEYPVVYDGDVMLTYYIGQYLVPALMGKIAGHSHMVAVWTLAVWNALGLSIAYVFLCQYLNAKTIGKKIAVLVVMMLWSGASNLGALIYQGIGHDAEFTSYKWIDINRVRVHFAPTIDTLRGSFQHLIVPWLSCSILLKHKKSYGVYVLLAFPLFYSAAFGFVYLVGIMVAYFFWDTITSRKYGENFKKALSMENLLLLPAMAVWSIYLGGNVFGQKPEGMGFEILNMFKYLDFYLIFILVEFMGYAVFLWKENRKNVFYYIILTELLLIPFFSLGMWNDLCSRGSIPARFFLMVLCVEHFFKYGMKNWRNIGIAVIILIASLNVAREIRYTTMYSMEAGLGTENLIVDNFNTLNGKAADSELRIDEAYNYFTLDYSNSLFHAIAREN